MNFKRLMKVIIFISILFKLIGGLVVLFTNSDIAIPASVQILNGVVILYGLLLLSMYRKSEVPGYIGLASFFLFDIIIFIVNILLINETVDTLYMLQLNMFQTMVIGNYLAIIADVIILIYFFMLSRKHRKES